MNQQIKTRNQVHQPQPKKRRIDKSGNDTRKMWLKEGTATMLFVNGLTENGCKGLINTINSYLIAHNKSTLPNNKFLITR